MYEELIKRLKSSAKWYEYGMPIVPSICLKAADAIEELSRLHEAQRQNLITLMNEEPETEWIPVTERLPENMTSVIVHRKDGGIFIWEYFNTSPTDECWIDDSMNVYSFYDVTHWMPLPEPPKEE